ncbi:TIGR03915 family putative DNA repair protein [Mangrovibacterium sp.]|uniref:TIGR03915 family putative DNA repair protein n=1 Tax=Mangrovibacterium sp. TaxID=1961364 RepID=UPI0035653F7A
MVELLYDGTFAGFLTAVFDCYAQKIEVSNIYRDTAFQNNLFADHILIETSEPKSQRVWTAIQQKLHPRNHELPILTFLSEAEGIEMRLFRFMQRAFASETRLDTNYGDPDILALKKIERQVLQEAMRILQFVRFQQTADKIYFAPIDPQYDVLPYAIKHFKERFSDQQWLIYDTKRDYGFFYNLRDISEVTLNDKTFAIHNGKLDQNLLQEDEVFYQTLWKSYFKHINIEERKNQKLQRQHMPRRYWKFLTEKN